MKPWKKIIPFVITLALGVIFFLPTVFAGDGSYGLNTTASRTGLKPKVNKSLPDVVGDILGTALSLVAIVFFILTLYGGFLWMTARGNSDQQSKARDTIFGAVIGLIIIMAAYAITTFVFNNLGPGGKPSAGPSGPGQTSCEKKFGEYGLSCKAAETCKVGPVAVSQYAIIFENQKDKTGKDAVYNYSGPTNPNSMGYTTDPGYFKDECPGGIEIVCCL